MTEEILASSPRYADDGQELSEIFHASYRRLVVQMYGVVGDISTAEDLVQEAFVRAAAAGNRFRRADDHEAWLRSRLTARDRLKQPTDLPGADQLVAMVSALRSPPEPGWTLDELREHAEHLVPLPDLDELQRRGARLRRLRLAGPALVAAALVAGGVVAQSSVWQDDAVAPVGGGAAEGRVWDGATELPPDAALPSTPVIGELVASTWSRGRTGWDGWVYVYADGRLIWQRRGPLPTTAWVEQRLTPEGLDLVQAEILSTGLFDTARPTPDGEPGRPPPGSELDYAWPSYGDIQVRKGDQLVLVAGRPGQTWTPQFDRLQQRLTELQSWLPATAWEDDAIRPYVPSSYAICPFRFPTPLDWSRILPLLPPAADELLADARPWRWDDPTSGSTCFEVTTERAREVAVALDDARVGRSLHEAPLAYLLKPPDAVAVSIGIDFWPFLPDGVPATTGP